MSDGTKQQQLAELDRADLDKVSGGWGFDPLDDAWGGGLSRPAIDDCGNYDYTGGAGYGWITESLYY